MDYGCWQCGAEESRVTSTARDDEGNRLRRRMCLKCGSIWLTEERRLAKDTRWFQRADSQARYQRARRLARRRVCRYCGGRYSSDYRRHLDGPKHKAWRRIRQEQIRRFKVEDSRWRYHHDPTYRRAQIDAATRRKKEKRNDAT